MIVLDACSIILLAKSTVLEELTKSKKIVISRGVYKEVLEGKDKKFLDALLTEKLVNEKRIIIRDNNNKEITKRFMDDFGLGVGESESVALALETDEKIIVTDNKQGRRAAKIYGLNLIGSIAVIMTLYKLKKINKEKTISALKSLREAGWFQDYLIDEALSEVKNG